MDAFAAEWPEIDLMWYQQDSFLADSNSYTFLIAFFYKENSD